MYRFQYQKHSYHPPRFLLSVCIFMVISLLFIQGITSFSADTVKRQKESLENAVMRSVTYCYAVEGRYPGNLQHLEKYYGLTYDKDLFFIDYRADGSNLLPDITIIERKEH